MSQRKNRTPSDVSLKSNGVLFLSSDYKTKNNMLKGAELILVPNDCESMKPRVQALSTRAYENMCGVAMANPNGRNAGHSCAFRPICWDENGECVDNTLLLADAETEGLFYAEWDMKNLRSYRKREMMGNTFRKVKTYAPLLDERVEYPFVR